MSSGCLVEEKDDAVEFAVAERPASDNRKV